MDAATPPSLSSTQILLRTINYSGRAHIVPRSKRGKNDPENLQALCDQCNRGKGNRDSTDFRKAETVTGCVFCAEDIEARIVERNGTVFAIADKYPMNPGHTLIIPVRHSVDFFSLTDTERNDSLELARYLKNRIQADDKTVTGFNMGYNCGTSAGQTVMHAHLHLVPRRDGDVPFPKGGIRGAVPDRMNYEAS